MKFVHIKDIAKFNSNNLSSTTFKGGCVSYLDTGNLTNGKVSSYQHIDLSESKLPSRAKRLVKQNSILYSTVRPNQRHFGIIDANNVPENLVVSTGFTVIDVNSDVADPYFVYYFLQQEKIIKKLTALAEQNVSAYPSIKASDIGELLMPLPNIRQQRQSIQILKYIDEKIRINEQINDNLKNQAQAVYYERFEKIDFKNRPFNWQLITLGDIAVISTKSLNPAKESDSLLEHYSIPAFDETGFPVFEKSSSIKSNKYLVDEFSLLVSKLNPTIKRIWRPYCLSNKAVCSTEFIVFKAKNKDLTDFLYSVIDSKSFFNFMCSHVTGSTGSRQRTTPAETLGFKLLFPSSEEIQNFQKLVAPMYKQIKINAIENDKLQQIRDDLLPKLLSGDGCLSF